MEILRLGGVGGCVCVRACVRAYELHSGADLRGGRGTGIFEARGIGGWVRGFVRVCVGACMRMHCVQGRIEK